MARNKGRGTRPAKTDATLPEKPQHDAPNYPRLSLRHVRNDFGVEELTEHQRSEFLLKWAKRSQFTWAELGTHPKHGLGYEYLPARQIKRTAPEELAQEKYMVMRHEGNLPIVDSRLATRSTCCGSRRTTATCTTTADDKRASPPTGGEARPSTQSGVRDLDPAADRRVATSPHAARNSSSPRSA